MNRTDFKLADFIGDYAYHSEYLLQNWRQKLEFADTYPLDRAVLYRKNPFPGIRTALWIDFHRITDLPAIFNGFKGLWMIETARRTVMVHGNRQGFSQRNIGGQVIHDLNLFDLQAPWLESLTLCFARETLAELLPDSPLLNDELLADVLYEINSKMLINSLQAFIEELEDDVINTMTREAAFDCHAYNHYIANDTIKHRNRLQATNAYPWLGHLLRQQSTFRYLVDSGKPLLSPLQQYLRVKPSTIKFCQTFTSLRVPVTQRIAILKSVDSYSEAYLPRSVADKQAFMHLHGGINDLAQVIGTSHSHLAKLFKHGWNAGLVKLEQQLGRTTEIHRVFEMMHASYFYGVRPILEDDFISCPTYPPDHWYAIWFARYGLRNLLQMADRWEKEFGEFSLNRLNGVAEKENTLGLHWPALLENTYSHGPFRVFELTSQAELETEGRKLEHCVASYTVNCLLAGSYIFAVRDYCGNSLSTFEVQYSHGTFQLMKHYARNNDEPSPEETVCVTLFIKDVLVDVGEEEVSRLRQKRGEIGYGIRSKLLEPDSDEKPITPDEEKALRDMVAFTHPKGWSSDDIKKYFDEHSEQAFEDNDESICSLF